MHPSEVLSPREAYGARLTCFVLDAALVAVASAPLGGGAGWLFALCFSALYLGVVQGLTGYSCAKAVMGVKVVRRGAAEAPGAGRGLLRWLLGLVELLIPVIAGTISAANGRRRRAGDFAAGTEVVGLAPPGRARVLYGVAYLAALSIFVALGSLDVFLIAWAIFVPILGGIAVVIAGYRHVPAAVGWLALAAYTVVPACYMSFASLCHRGEHGCSDLTHAHRAIPALVVVLAGLIAFFVLRGIAAHVTLAVASTVAALWMFVQMRTGEDVAFAAAVELILLALVVFVEVTRHLARQRSRLLELAGEAGTASAGG